MGVAETPLDWYEQAGHLKQPNPPCSCASSAPLSSRISSSPEFRPPDATGAEECNVETAEHFSLLYRSSPPVSPTWPIFEGRRNTDDRCGGGVVDDDFPLLGVDELIKLEVRKEFAFADDVDLIPMDAEICWRMEFIGKLESLIEEEEVVVAVDDVDDEAVDAEVFAEESKTGSLNRG